MEFGLLKSQVAALVLGYLKSESCSKAFNEFLEESPHFQNNKENIKMGEFFVTRIAGMCLVDILEEYFRISFMVQGRLEASDYYNEGHTKATLIEQILYLLEDRKSVAKANSTPVDVTGEIVPPATSFVENQELHETIIDTTNIVQKTSEIAPPISNRDRIIAVTEKLFQKLNDDLAMQKAAPILPLSSDFVITPPADMIPDKTRSTSSLNNPPSTCSSSSDNDSIKILKELIVSPEKLQRQTKKDEDLQNNLMNYAGKAKEESSETRETRKREKKEKSKTCKDGKKSNTQNDDFEFLKNINFKNLICQKQQNGNRAIQTFRYCQ